MDIVIYFARIKEHSLVSWQTHGQEVSDWDVAWDWECWFIMCSIEFHAYPNQLGVSHSHKVGCLIRIICKVSSNSSCIKGYRCMSVGDNVKLSCSFGWSHDTQNGTWGLRVVNIDNVCASNGWSRSVIYVSPICILIMRQIFSFQEFHTIVDNFWVSTIGSFGYIAIWNKQLYYLEKCKMKGHYCLQPSSMSNSTFFSKSRIKLRIRSESNLKLLFLME